MLDAEILKAAPQFELPSGLPEVIAELRRLIGDSDVSVTLSPVLMEAAKLLNRIPAMVEEIGRLRNRVDELQGSMKLDGRYLSNMESLRALNAELRDALAPFAAWIASRDNNYASVYPDDCPLAYSPDRLNAGSATVGDLRKVRVILAKCESQSATTQPRIPGLPAQAPTAIPTQPAPGGIIETEKGI